MELKLKVKLKRKMKSNLLVLYPYKDSCRGARPLRGMRIQE
jgi:hypothetical protein